MTNKFTQIKKINDEITFARNSENEFWRILRKSQNDENGNYKMFGDRKTHKEVVLKDASEIVDEIKFYKNNSFERFKPKDDHNNTNVCDNPGFGSVRLSPPYEDKDFDKEYFGFIDSLITDEDVVVDYGGSYGLNLGCLSNEVCEKLLVEKKDTFDIPEYNIKYIDGDNFDFNKKYDYFFCYHTIEHLSDPEATVLKIANSTSKIAFFAAPLREIIETSIYHYIYVDIDIVLELLKKCGGRAFIHISKNHPLDIHFMIIKDAKVFKQINSLPFFKKYWIFNNMLSDKRI